MFTVEEEMASKQREKPAKASPADPRFVRVVEAFAEDPRVSHDEGKGFGSGALKVNGRIFAMISSKRKFVVKLPQDRVDDLVASGQGERFDPGHGRLMKEWLVVTAGEAQWTEIAREAYRFVKGYKL